MHFCPKFGPRIRVVDDVAKTIRWGLRRYVWKKARNRAFRLWRQAGIGFALEVGAGTVYKGQYSQDPADSISFLYIPGAIRLVRTGDDGPPEMYESGRNDDMAFYDPNKDSSIASYMPKRGWWNQYYLPSLVRTVTHELGHCLGLAHRPGGIMGARDMPDEHDLSSIRAYYLG